jgi:hypothetical protein
VTSCRQAIFGGFVEQLRGGCDGFVVRRFFLEGIEFYKDEGHLTGFVPQPVLRWAVALAGEGRHYLRVSRALPGHPFPFFPLCLRVSVRNPKTRLSAFSKGGHPAGPPEAKETHAVRLYNVTPSPNGQAVFFSVSPWWIRLSWVLNDLVGC